jgi:hypothetical protein
MKSYEATHIARLLAMRGYHSSIREAGYPGSGLLGRLRPRQDRAQAPAGHLRGLAAAGRQRERESKYMTTNARTGSVARPRYDPRREEWSLRLGPGRWLVWQHGTRPGDAERLQAELARELEREAPMTG